MSRHLFAIQLNSDAVSGILLNVGLKSYTVEACANIPLPPSGTDDPLPAALADLIDHINLVHLDHAVVLVSLPADQILYRSLVVPFKDPKKIAQILPFELEPTLPVPVETLAIDFKVRFLPETTEILAAAVDRHTLSQILDDFQSAGLKPQVIIPGGSTMVHAAWSSAHPLPEHYIWLDMAKAHVTFSAMIENHICMVRTLPLNTEAQEPISTLVLKVQQTLTAFAELKAIDYAPSQIYLSGLDLLGQHDLETLGQALSIPIQKVDLRDWFPRVEVADTVSEWNAAQFDNALALALVEADSKEIFCFHRSGSPLGSLWASYYRNLKTPAVLLLIVLILSLGGVFFDIHLLQKQLDSLNDQIKDTFISVFPETSRIVDPVIQMQTKMDELKKKTADAVQTGEKFRCVDILYQISQLIPKETDVLMTRLSIGNDGITITGETAGFNTVDDIKGRLEKSTLFSKVTIAAANMDKSGNKVQFRLKIDL